MSIQKFLDDPSVEYSKKQGVFKALEAGEDENAISSYIEDKYYKGGTPGLGISSFKNLGTPGTSQIEKEMDFGKQAGIKKPTKYNVKPSKPLVATEEKAETIPEKTTIGQDIMSGIKTGGQAVGNVVGGAVAEAPSFAGKTLGTLAGLVGLSGAEQAIKGAGEDISGFIKQYGAYQPESTGAEVGKTITDIGGTVLGPTKFIKGPGILKGIGQGLLGAEQYAAGTEGRLATGEELAAGGLIGGAIPAIGKGAKFVSKVLPESLQVSGALNPTDLKNASERLARLTGKDAEITDVSRWLLDRGIKGDIPTQRELIKSGIEQSKAGAKELLQSVSGEVDNAVTKGLRKALGEKVLQYADKTKTGLRPTAGNEETVNRYVQLIKKPKMTLSEIDEARGLLGDGIFTKQGTAKELASKEGWKNIWKDASKFIEEKAPGFRKFNKDTEVGIAIENAMAKKDAAANARQMLSYLGFSTIGGGAGYGASGGDIESALKGAAIGFGGAKIQQFLNSPTVKTNLAFYLNKLSPSARRSMSELQKGVKISPSSLDEIVQEIKAMPEEVKKNIKSTPISELIKSKKGFFNPSDIGKGLGLGKKENRIGVGSDRNVFDNGDGTVTKKAKNGKGLIQNMGYDEELANAGVIPKATEVGPGYIKTEKITTFDNAIEKDKDVIDRFVNEVSGMGTAAFRDNGKIIPEALSDLKRILRSYGMGKLADKPDSFLKNVGWGDINLDNVGIKNGKPIIIDEGVLNYKLLKRMERGEVGGLNVFDKRYDAMKK